MARDLETPPVTFDVATQQVSLPTREEQPLNRDGLPSDNLRRASRDSEMHSTVSNEK